MDNRRLILLLVFSFSLVMLWDGWQKHNQPKVPATAAAAGGTAGVPTPTTAGAPGAVAVPGQPAAPAPVAAPKAIIRTDVLVAEVSAQGGDIVRLELTKHHSSEDNTRNYVLFDNGEKHNYAAQTGLIGNGLPNHKTLFTLGAAEATLKDGENAVTLRLDAPPTADGIKVAKLITFNRGSYQAEVSYEITNGSGAPIAPHAYFQFTRDGKPAEQPGGIGVRGTVEGRRLALGNTALMEQEGVAVSALRADGERLRGEGASIMHLAVDGVFAGILAVTDPIKASTPDAIRTLHASGLRIVMATGDGLTTAKAVGAKLGIDEVHGEVKPADKLALVEKLQREGHVVAMAGDGINDAPALAKADVGVAMGTGTDVAMNSGQITLIKGDLRGIASAREISIDTVRNMRQNLLFAFVYNGIGVPIAAGVFYPFTGWLLSPLIAALAMSLSSASVIFNALRLRGVK